MLVEAFAKINWSLDITGIREDGYHLIDMLMQPISLADEITLLPAAQTTLTVSGFPYVRANTSNLALRAAEAFQSATGFSSGVSIHLLKRIPVGAGLGGGSADAAAVLYGLNRMWRTGCSQDELEKIGLTLGADIPFCLRGGLTRTQGIGECLENHSCRANYRLVVVQPCRGLSTREVFEAWHQSRSAVRPDTEAALAALESGNLVQLCENISNVLQTVSIEKRPEIGLAIQRLRQLGAVAAQMTGSGSAVFGVFQTASAAEHAKNVLATRWRSVFLCHTQSDSIRISED